MTNEPTTVKPDRQQATEFLEALYGQFFKDQDGWVEVRFIPADKSGPVGQAFSRQGKVNEEAWAEIKKQNRHDHVFVGVNPRNAMRGRNVDIDAVICLWVDVDGKEEGGKDGALHRLEAFPILPSILVDSGHGYHAYWLLTRSIINITAEQRLQVRQTLSGLVKALKADRARTDLSSCLRLPGTVNAKPGEESVPCTLLHSDPSRTYSLADFARYRDTEYKEPEGTDEPLPEFGERECIITDESEEAAQAAVSQLRITERHKKMIRFGKPIRLKDITKSGRDMSIIDSLVGAGYNYATIRSIFFNKYLACSDRISREGEGALIWDVKKAVKWVEDHRLEVTPRIAKVIEIKTEKGVTEFERHVKLMQYVTDDLLTGPKPVGVGFREVGHGPFFFFDQTELSVMDVYGEDFDLLLNTYYKVKKSDRQEMQKAVAGAIRDSHREATPQTVHYFDRDRHVMYWDNGGNGIYRIDENEIRLVNNGDDGVFFRECPRLVPYDFPPNAKVVNYFDDKFYKNRFQQCPTGLSLEAFYSKESLLNRFWLSLASFGKTPDNELEPEDQRLLLIIYFYALFFESIFTEKPVAGFVGKLQSGKTFLATTIGKIIFGEKFCVTAFPTEDDFLRAVFHQNRFVVLDDVKKIPASMLGTLHAYATQRPLWGRRILRELGLVNWEARVFFCLTATTMEGWDEEFMRRVLLFNTVGLTSPKEPETFWEPLFRDRDLIMAEIMVNVQSILRLLKYYKKAPFANLPNITAAFSSFGQKITGPLGSRLQFQMSAAKMVAKKSRSLFEEDPFWLTLRYLMFERITCVDGEQFFGQQELEPCFPQQLLERLQSAADEMKLKDFDYQYKTSKSIGRAFDRFRGDLEQQLRVIEISCKPQRKIGFERKPEEEKPAEKGAEPLSPEKQAFLDWEQNYKDDRLPEGINEVGEERDIEPGSDEWAEAIVKTGMDTVTDEERKEMLARIKRLEKEEKK